MTQSAQKIIAIDDDPKILNLLSRYLSREGYQVRTASTGEELRHYMDTEAPDLVLLDLMLPQENGFSLAKELRSSYDVGIIMVTGKIDPVDKVVGLELGADDYVTKPFDERELLARVRSVLRRSINGRRSSEQEEVEKAKFEGWELDFRAHRLLDPSGERVHLTSHEFQLLVTLVRRPNQALSREAILDAVTHRDYLPYDRSIDVLVGKLRKKIEPNCKHPTLIKTVRGVGYMFAAAVTFQ